MADPGGERSSAAWSRRCASGPEPKKKPAGDARRQRFGSVQERRLSGADTPLIRAASEDADYFLTGAFFFIQPLCHRPSLARVA